MEAVQAASNNGQAQATRDSLSRTLAEAFALTGSRMWLTGALIGGDRVGGVSPFKFGSDATVGLATIAQTAGQLIAGTIVLLEQDNIYAAAALVRQLVEVEYLAWAFSTDQEEAETWLRCSAEERRKMWQPRHLRQRADGRFRGVDYASHCERGGHPTPSGLQLLPDHSGRDPSGVWWFDLCSHGTSAWKYMTEAIPKYQWVADLPEAESTQGVARRIEQWHTSDGLFEVYRTIDDHRANPERMDAY